MFALPPFGHALLKGTSEFLVRTVLEIGLLPQRLEERKPRVLHRGLRAPFDLLGVLETRKRLIVRVAEPKLHAACAILGFHRHGRVPVARPAQYEAVTVNLPGADAVQRGPHFRIGTFQLSLQLLGRHCHRHATAQGLVGFDEMPQVHPVHDATLHATPWPGTKFLAMAAKARHTRECALPEFSFILQLAGAAQQNATGAVEGVVPAYIAMPLVQTNRLHDATAGVGVHQRDVAGAATVPSTIRDVDAARTVRTVSRMDVITHAGRDDLCELFRAGNRRNAQRQLFVASRKKDFERHPRRRPRHALRRKLCRDRDGATFPQRRLPLDNSRRATRRKQLLRSREGVDWNGRS
mmetsp:Transcript_102174/g.288618  ORF Transcript_102174/g.288618 Transcript_102174/m.288618 type:complete len:351 (+) Transcript_102174:181-1233(+)